MTPDVRLDMRGTSVTIDWAALYQEVYPGLVRYLHSKVWDADRARELAQDVFVRALRRILRIRAPGSLPWPPTSPADESRLASAGRST